MIVWGLVTVIAIQAIVILNLRRELQESWREKSILLKRIHAFQDTVDELIKKNSP